MKANDIFIPKAVIFDMDGLLLDTESVIIPLWVEAGKIIGRDIKPETAIKSIGISGNNEKELCFRELGDDFPFDLFFRELYKLAEVEFGKGITLKKGFIQSWII